LNEFSGYNADHEQAMRVYCRSLPEDHRRRYAAIESLKIGYGGIAHVAHVARVLGMSRRAIHTGIRELEHMGEDDPDDPKRPSGDAKRVRRRGGGRPFLSQVQRAWSGVMLDSARTTLETVENARTQTGLRVTAGCDQN
jgi:hypothetical protein